MRPRTLTDNTGATLEAIDGFRDTYGARDGFSVGIETEHRKGLHRPLSGQDRDGVTGMGSYVVSDRCLRHQTQIHRAFDARHTNCRWM
jgi:hypothetical protein